VFVVLCRLNVVPKGIFDLLTYLNDRYNQPTFLVTEYGCDVPDENSLSLSDALNDTFRVNYYSDYLSYVLKAIDNGVKVRGYFAWSLMVNNSMMSDILSLYFILCCEICRITLSGQTATPSDSVCTMWYVPFLIGWRS
jgi:beta-glucosidase